MDALTSLEDKNEFDEMLHETASDVSKTLSMAVEILANLMTFNKIETGIMTLHKQDINVKQYINDVANTFAAEAREKGIYSNNSELSNIRNSSLAQFIQAIQVTLPFQP